MKTAEIAARAAAIKDGWMDLFGFWFFTDHTRYDEYVRPLYFFGTAKDLCLGQGITFESDMP